MARTVVEDSPILSRLQYLIEYLFAGDVRESEKRLGMYRRQLEYILRRQAKIPHSLLSALVVDYGVSAHWLLTGSGAVFHISAFPPVSTLAAKEHELFDPTAMRVRPEQIAVPTPTLISKKNVPDLAAAIYNARIHKAPVIFLFDWRAMQPKSRQAIVWLLQANHITALATTTRALYKDVGWLAPQVILAAQKAARCGMGLGASVGRWLHLENDSVFHVAYAQNVPAAVYYQPGDDYRYFESAALGPTVGAEIGAATQIDLFMLAEQIRLFVTKEHSVCVDTTNHPSVTALLTTTIAAAHRTTDERQGCLFKIGSQLLPFVFQSCQTVFKGNHSAGRRNLRFRYR